MKITRNNFNQTNSISIRCDNSNSNVKYGVGNMINGTCVKTSESMPSTKFNLVSTASGVSYETLNAFVQHDKYGYFGKSIRNDSIS